MNLKDIEYEYWKKYIHLRNLTCPNRKRSGYLIQTPINWVYKIPHWLLVLNVTSHKIAEAYFNVVKCFLPRPCSRLSPPPISLDTDLYKALDRTLDTGSGQAPGSTCRRSEGGQTDAGISRLLSSLQFRVLVMLAFRRFFETVPRPRAQI